MAKVQKGAADAAAKLIAKYGKAAVSSAVRNFKPVAKVKVTGSGATGNGRFPTSNVKPKKSPASGITNKGNPAERYTREKSTAERYRSFNKKN